MKATPKRGEIVPNFTLRGLTGESVSLWDYRQKNPLALVLCGADSSRLIQSMSRRHGDYQALGAEILALVPRRPDGETAPFPVVLDENLEISRRLSSTLPAVLVLDRFNELRDRVQVGKDLDHREILDALFLSEIACSDCGEPEWPREESV